MLGVESLAHLLIDLQQQVTTSPDLRAAVLPRTEHGPDTSLPRITALSIPEQWKSFVPTSDHLFSLREKRRPITADQPNAQPTRKLIPTASTDLHCPLSEDKEPQTASLDSDCSRPASTQPQPKRNRRNSPEKRADLSQRLISDIMTITPKTPRNSTTQNSGCANPLPPKPTHAVQSGRNSPPSETKRAGCADATSASPIPDQSKPAAGASPATHMEAQPLQPALRPSQKPKPQPILCKLRMCAQ